MNNESYLASARQQFLYYKSLGEKAIAQLEPEQLLIKSNDESNSIAMIVQHMAGNMLSRWTNFLTSDVEKVWRDRDAEFEVILTNKEEVMRKWDEGWTCFLEVINQLQPAQLNQTILIRSELHTVVEAKTGNWLTTLSRGTNRFLCQTTKREFICKPIYSQKQIR